MFIIAEKLAKSEQQWVLSMDEDAARKYLAQSDNSFAKMIHRLQIEGNRLRIEPI